MCAYQLKIAKYYRLTDKTSVETENVAVLVDTKARRLSVSCRQVEKENVPISSEPGAFPRLMFRDTHLYVLFSAKSTDGFRLTFAAREREGFLKMMHSMGVLRDVPVESSSQFSFSKESQDLGSVRMESQGNPQRQYRPSSSCSSSSSTTHHRPPAFTQQPTPQVSLFPPNVRRDTTDVFSLSQPLPSDSPSFRHHPYGTMSSSSRMCHSQRISSHEHGEAVQKKRREFEGIEEKEKLDQATQTDDLIDVLIEDADFVKKAVSHLMENRQFVSVVRSMRSRLENMATVERERLHWKTNPNLNSQGMPPPVIHLPNSDAE